MHILIIRVMRIVTSDFLLQESMEKVHRTDIMEGFRRNVRHIARIDAIIAGLLINALFTGIAIDLMLSHGQNENNMKEITGVINE